MQFLIFAGGDGEWRWRLEDRFGRVLAVSPCAYPDQGQCRVAAEAVKWAHAAPVRELQTEWHVDPPPVDPAR